MAKHDLITPEPRETRYIRATTPVAVELHQPVAPGQVRTIPGRLLGETRVDGKLHHYRVESTFLSPRPNGSRPKASRPSMRRGTPSAWRSRITSPAC